MYLHAKRKLRANIHHVITVVLSDNCS